MAKLYIANCSKQDFLLTYMLPENPRAFMHHIRPGAQHLVEGDQQQLQWIVDQHAKYGMQEADKVSRGFGGRCYRFDKPVSVEAIELGLSQSDQEAIDRALQARQATAVAADAILDRAAEQVGARPTGELSVEVIEENKDPTRQVQFGETITVEKPGVEHRGGRRQPGRR